jgi:hypothetical protein
MGVQDPSRSNGIQTQNGCQAPRSNRTTALKSGSADFYWAERQFFQFRFDAAPVSNGDNNHFFRPEVILSRSLHVAGGYLVDPFRQVVIISKREIVNKELTDARS